MSEVEFQPKGAIWFLIILVLVAFALSVIYFSRNNPDLTGGTLPIGRPITSRQPRVYTVFYGLKVFSPTNIRIHVGDSIRFQNDSKVTIRIVSDSTGAVPDLPGFDSIGDIQSEGVFTYTFSSVGTFGYHNTKNPEESGTIIVRP